MTSAISDFLESLHESRRSLPPALQHICAELLASYAVDPSSRGLERMDWHSGLCDASTKGVAHRIYWWFPTHFFKFQEALLRWEQKCAESGQPFLLGRANVTFVDLGCGAGAASAALLATIGQYQDFCSRHAFRADPVTVRIIGLDRVEAELTAYETVADLYAAHLHGHRVVATVETVAGAFPEDIGQVIRALGSVRGHVLVVGMSNLIKWIWDEWDEEFSGEGPGSSPELTPAEMGAIQQLAENIDFDWLHVVGVATQTQGGSVLARKLKDLLDGALRVLRREGRRFGQRWSTQPTVLFENPEACGWAQKRPFCARQYYVEYMVSATPAYARDKRLHDALSLEALECAWAKVRTYMRYESLTDEIELRLFEHDLERNLAALRAACLDRDYSCLNVEHSLPYEFPKADDAMRPRSLSRLEDQIVATALGIEFSRELQGPCPEVSYSYRLARRQTEFLYDYWFALYREYLSDILRHLGAGYVSATDIKSYYVNVRQETLLSLLEDAMRDSNRSYDLLAATIDRDCGPGHLSGYGLIQGHALSGLLSNVMLQPLDHRLLTSRGKRGRYFRFTDDMTVTQTRGADGTALQEIGEELSAIDRRLKLSEGKTRHLDQASFRRRAYGSKRLNDVAKRFRALLLPLYVLNHTYRKEFSQREWGFAHAYQDLLAGLGVTFAPEWLYRKLDEYRRPRRLMTTVVRKWRPDWPSLSLMRTQAGRRQWCRHFEARNADWTTERNALKSELAVLLRGAAEAIMGEDLSEEAFIRRRRELKFALYRLSVFGVDAAVVQIERLLISQPWDIPVGIACDALGRIQETDRLVKVAKESQSVFVRAAALRALGDIRALDTVRVLASVLSDQSEPIERLMASEALLAIDLWQALDFDAIADWLQREASAPYILKNIVLMLARAYPDEAGEVLADMDSAACHPIVRKSLHYALHKAETQNLLWAPEPDVLKKYRAHYYPTIEELLGDPGSYGIISE